MLIRPSSVFRTTFFLLALLIAFSMLAGSGCYFRPDPPTTLRILFTSETQGMFTPCGCVGGPRGGFAKRSTAIREARESAAGPVILLDTGNFSTGVVTDGERLKAEFATRAMAMLDYDAVNVGLMDSKRPRLGVHTYASEGCPLTSAGFAFIDENNEDITSEIIDPAENPERKFSFESHIIVDLDGYKVGIIGSPLTDIRPEIVGFQNEPDVTVEELYHMMEGIQAAESVGMFIMLSDIDTSWQITTEIGRQLPMATVLIGGQSADHDFTDEKTTSEIPSWPVFIPRAATWGRALGVLDIEFTPQGGIEKYSLRYVDLNEDVEKDPAFDDITEQFLTEMSEIGSNAVPQIRSAGYVGGENCVDCHLPQAEHWETTAHAAAWDTLEATGRLRESTCVPCHTTGYAQASQMPERLVPHEFRNVGCEACHGPGRVHIEYQSWKIYGTLTGETRGEDLVDPIIKTPPESTCIVCHTSPHDEGWLYNSKRDRVYHH